MTERPDVSLMLKMLPGLPAVLILTARDAGRVISARPDIWIVISAYLTAAIEAAQDEEEDS